MFLSPKIWGCKYTNNFLFINKNPVFQHFDLLITFTTYHHIPRSAERKIVTISDFKRSPETNGHR